MSSEIKTLWTIMIYMAADNDLVGDAWKSVIQITTLAAGNPVFEDQVRVVFQLDESDPLKPTRRFFRRGAIFDKEIVGKETNTGDPQTLVDFIEWAYRNNPAQNYLLILWGHANGVDDEDTVVNLTASGSTPESEPAPHAVVVPPPAPPQLSAPAASDNGNAASLLDDAEVLNATRMFSSSLVDAMLVDSTLPDAATGRSLDALTTFELKAALEAATNTMGRKISILGMDACLLSLIEVCYQVSEQADFYIGSEEVIPNTSWPYDRILRKLAERPSMQPPELAETIVDEYLAAYNEKTGADRKKVTLSFCDLRLSQEIAGRISILSGLLSQKLSDPGFRALVVEARSKTQSFSVPDYVDLHHFCQLIRDTTDDKEIEYACQSVMDGIKLNFVRKAGHTKLENPEAVDTLANTNGLSIYFPRILHTYTSLDFSKQTQWDSFLNGYMNAVFQPTDETAAADDEKVGEGNSADDVSLSQSPAMAISSSPDTAVAGVGSHHLNTGGNIIMNDYKKDSTATATGTGSGATGAAAAAETTNPDAGLTKADEANAAPTVPETKKAHIVLPIDASITYPQGNVLDTLTAEAFLLFEGQNVVIEVPDGTPLASTATPDNKASRNTETKATIGTRVVPALGAEIRLPACTLWKPFADGSLTDLPAGTVVKTAVSGAQLVILEEVGVRGF